MAKYVIRFNAWDAGLDDEDAESWTESNKDEVIDRLLWLLRRLEYPIDVTYPDGEVY
tara:strand:- start:187 stop:357 length:171 start_codon:yes stop_codon:yes gene_type:complete